MKKGIATTLAPNYEADDVWLSLGLLFCPWRWRSGPAVFELEQAFCQRFQVRHAVAFATGRGALCAILLGLLHEGDEVMLQAFTCVAVPEAVQWAGGTPVYVDINPATYTMDPADLAQKITPRCRAIIVQHTFGCPADCEQIVAIAKRHGLVVIEDCAHAVGVRYRGRTLGQFGQAAFFSFGRDKAMSSVFGGMCVTNDDALAKALRTSSERSVVPPARWVFQQLLHPVITAVALQTLEFFSLGKIIMRVNRWLHVLSLAVTPEERHGRRPRFASFRLPNALAVLALHQCKKIDRFNRHRAAIVQEYQRALQDDQSVITPQNLADQQNLLLYTIRVNNSEQVIERCARAGVHLGEWYRTVIAPHDVDVASVGYAAGSCPQAEMVAREVVNLPTHIHVTVHDARRVVETIRAQKL